MKKQDEEKWVIKFQQDAIAYFLRQRIINTVESGAGYDLNEQFNELRNNAGTIISTKDFLNAIRTAEEDPSKLKEGAEHLMELNVSLVPGCLKRPWWNLLMEDFRKLKEGTL